MTNDKMTDVERLLNCPFCGNTDSDDNAVQEAAVHVQSFKSPAGGYALRVECACGAKGRSSRSADEAIKYWNTRPLTGGVTQADVGVTREKLADWLNAFKADPFSTGENRVDRLLAMLRASQDGGGQ